MMKNALKRLGVFLGVSEGYKANAIDRDGDGVVQEGTKSERPVAKKKAPAKKPAAKKPAAPKKK
jgi:hypothetical protein